ncbi:Rz1-like lysis system protein LysC [Motiliproteus sp.]|uniref:Rz1-like lysis system protein LysC n=1 Tax=Motiliproteus sp. TaxID=1898955 RepID=UPI003BAA4D9D
MLSGCGSAPPLPVQTLISSTCPTLTACTLSPSAPQQNGDLMHEIDRVEADWAICAAKVDEFIKCQAEDREHNRRQRQKPNGKPPDE